MKAMKKIYFILIFLFSLNFVYTKVSFNKNFYILIVPFQNLSFSENDDYIKYILYDAIISFLDKSDNFYIDDSFDKIELSTLKEDLIIKMAKMRNISLLISGYFIKINNEIKITLKITDLKSEKVLFIEEFINKDENSLQGDILNSLRNGINKILKIDFYKQDIIEIKNQNFILNVVNEEFLFFEMGISYSILSNIVINKEVTNDFDISSVENNYFNSIIHYYSLEYYKSYKNSFYGFGLAFSLPFEIDKPKFYADVFCGFSFLFGYKKKFFFKWSIELISRVLRLYSMKIEYKDKFDLIDSNLGIGFNFRYLSNKYNFFIETGFSLVPTLNFIKSDKEENMIFNKIIVNMDTNNNSFLIPVLLNFEIGKFVNQEIGFFIRTVLSFYYFDYSSRFIRKYNDETFYLYKWDFGDSFNVNIKIIFGIAFKSLVY